MESFIAGTLSGIAQTISGHPFDTLKVLLQTDKKFKLSNLNFNQTSFYKLYRGMLGPITTNAIVTGAQFHYYHKYNGIIAGTVSGLLVAPIDFFKIQKQINGKYFINKQVMINIIKSYPITILREVPAMGLYFNSYYYLKNKTNNPFISGGIAGVLSWIPSYPIDTLKTRIQQGLTLKSSFNKGMLFSGFSMCITRAFIVNSVGFYVSDLFINVK